MKLDKVVRIYCSLSAVAAITERGYLDAARQLGNPHIHEITLKKLILIRDNCQSPFSWNSLLGKLRATIRFAAKRGWAEENHPVFIIKRIHAKPPFRNEISKSDRNHFIRTIIQTKRFTPFWFWTTLFDVLYYSGIRRKQLCYLKWGDLDLNSSTIILRAAGSKNKRERMLPLHNDLTKSLLVYRTYIETALDGLPIDSAMQVFHLQAARQLAIANPNDFKPQAVTTFFNRLSKSAGQNINAHLLRHSFATKIAREIPNIKMVQLLLNHDRTDTTMRYIHPTLADMRNVMSLPLTAARKK
jgi:integrase